MICFFLDEEVNTDFNSKINKWVEAGAALYTTAIHFQVARSLFKNPELSPKRYKHTMDPMPTCR